MNQIDPNWEVSVQDVKRMLDDRTDFLLLDVRQPDEGEVCKIDGARLVPLPELGERLNELREMANGRPVIAHCHHGGRSLQAAAILRQAGLGEVRSMAGGIHLWALQIDSNMAQY